MNWRDLRTIIGVLVAPAQYQLCHFCGRPVWKWRFKRHVWEVHRLPWAEKKIKGG